ncbi:MAG TPA: hypothetical protein ENJ02_00975 [Chloroflexi bacterium]|nr:hypothetical protein [Chloroflexota bacterium]
MAKRIWGSLLGVLLGFAGAGALFWAARPPQGTPVTLRPPPTPAPLVVDVDGAVAAPGVYSLPPESRVRDALDAAGGLLPEADTRSLNLAAPLEDGTRLWVPALPQETAAPQSRSVSPGSLGGQASSPGTETTSKINLNTASQEELESLPGIGPALAENIITYRQEHGPFVVIDEIQNVSGIGPAKFEKIRDLITVAP